MDCLKDLHDSHNDLASKFGKIVDRVSNVEKNSGKDSNNNDTRDKGEKEEKVVEISKQSGNEVGSKNSGISES